MNQLFIHKAQNMDSIETKDTQARNLEPNENFNKADQKVNCDDRLAALDELTQLSQALGMGYEK